MRRLKRTKYRYRQDYLCLPKHVLSVLHRQLFSHILFSFLPTVYKHRVFFQSFLLAFQSLLHRSLITDLIYSIFASKLYHRFDIFNFCVLLNYSASVHDISAIFCYAVYNLFAKSSDIIRCSISQ